MGLPLMVRFVPGQQRDRFGDGTLGVVRTGDGAGEGGGVEGGDVTFEGGVAVGEGGANDGQGGDIGV